MSVWLFSNRMKSAAVPSASNKSAPFRHRCLFGGKDDRGSRRESRRLAHPIRKAQDHERCENHRQLFTMAAHAPSNHRSGCPPQEHDRCRLPTSHGLARGTLASSVVNELEQYAISTRDIPLDLAGLCVSTRQVRIRSSHHRDFHLPCH